MSKTLRILAATAVLAVVSCALQGSGEAADKQERTLPKLSVSTIDPSEIKPGMKGYGLSVFKGGEPERFEVEVVDVVPHALPKQDMILIMCKGQNLEDTKVVAGMSGSPIYIEGRLAGALAYGWGFSREPLAGVTPIKNMQNSLSMTSVASSKAHSPALASLSPEKEKNDTTSGYGSIRPIRTPLLVSGISEAGLSHISSEFEEYGMVPVAGGALGSDELSTAGIESMKPGSAIGAALMIGDISMTAIGTLTWREGNEVLAFGHPFLQGGPISMPITSARIHTIVSTQTQSFKMGTPTGVVGELVMDEQAAIVGVLGREAKTVPVSIRTTRKATGYDEATSVLVADQPTLTPILVQIATMEGVRSAAPAFDPTTARIKTTLELEKYGQVSYTDVYPILRGSFSRGFLDPVMFFATNPFERVMIKDVDIDIEITDELEIAAIESVWMDTDEVGPGDTVKLFVKLSPYDSPDPVVYSFEVNIPDDETMRRVTVMVSGGSRARPDQAVPRGVPDMIRFMDAVYPSDRLVIMWQTKSEGVDVDGIRLRDLPPSVTSMLQPNNSTETGGVRGREYRSLETPYVVVGAERVVIDVNGKRKSKNRKR